MSRWSESGPGLALTLVLAVAVAPPAYAAPPDGSTTAPVVTVVAPVLDIAFVQADSAGTARVERLPRRTRVTLDATVLFARDRATVRPAAARRLRQVGAELRTRGPGRVTVTGYTDDLGSAAHGRTLSRARAAAVGRVLRTELGAEVSLVLVGRGEADPAVPNTSEANRRINRRVVVLFESR